MVGHREAVLVPHAVEREVDDLHGVVVAVGNREAVLVPHAVEREVDDLHGLAVVDAAEVPASCVVRAYLLLGRGALLLEAQIRGRAAGVGTRAGRARTSRPERRGDRYCRAGRRGSEASPQLAKADDWEVIITG